MYSTFHSQKKKKEKTKTKQNKTKKNKTKQNKTLSSCRLVAGSNDDEAEVKWRPKGGGERCGNGKRWPLGSVVEAEAEAEQQMKVSYGLWSDLSRLWLFDPPTYDVFRDDYGAQCFTGLRADSNVDVHLLDTKVGNKIVAAFWRHPFARLTLLYSHGNAADLGQMQDLFIELRAHLRINIMSYDYSGYGASSGKPTEFNTYHDIEAVYNCLKSKYEIKQEDVVLYGQSVGSGPTLHLASRLKRLRGVVLHSAILSGIRVLYPVKMTLWFDIFKNIDKIREVNCPVLVIHF
nr:protein ABHD17B [Ipomoea batatas]